MGSKIISRVVSAIIVCYLLGITFQHYIVKESELTKDKFLETRARNHEFIKDQINRNKMKGVSTIFFAFFIVFYEILAFLIHMLWNTSQLGSKR
jgi:hypothetical protein